VLAALIIVFREVFEAGLIIGIVLAVTRSVPHRNQWIGAGVLAGAPAQS
jgi:high-affinity iron transporter